MAEYFVNLFLLCFLNLLVRYECKEGDNTDNDLTDLTANGGQEPIRTESDYVYWPFASIPFYIDPLHFDHEQSLSIMTALSMFSFKTCLKFAPVLVRPEGNQHVLLIENPNGVRQCQFSTIGHSIDEPHRLVLGYDCLKSPQIDMMIMRALGFPFEHNRAIRNIYIDVQPENVEPAYVELFTKDGHLPMQLRSLPYDINSVMHFGEREFSKNGHRTIIFKDHKVHQIRNGLTPTDIKKIQIVYGPECILRDRQEKIELCQNFPGVARKKREIDTPDPTKSLRVNRNITPPKNVIVEEPQSDNHTYDEVSKSLTDLGIENEVQLIVDQVNKVSAMALRHAREKFCNKTKPDLRFGAEIKKKRIDILGIVESVAQYAQSMVDHATANLTEFCEQSRSLELYQRQRAKCPFFNKLNCPQTYKSTKSGPVKYSTQHRPLIRQSTKHHGAGLARGQYDSMYRARDDDNATAPENATEKTARRKREVHRRKFVVYPLNSDANARRKRDLGDSPMSLSEAAVTTPASIESTTTTERNARKKRDIDTQDFNVAPLILNEMYGIPRRKRDVAESAKSESEVTTQTSSSLTTPAAEAVRRKRDVAETTKSEPEVTTQTSTTEGTTEASTSTATESVATETSVPNANDAEKPVANENKTVTNENTNEKSVLNENKNETNDKSPRLSEMDVVIVSTDKTGGYVDAEVVSKGDLRMGTRLPRDGSKWAPVDRRHQTPFRRMFRAKFPAETRRRGHFETVNWDEAGTDDDQKEIEDAKRVIREDPDLQIILEGNKAKMLEEKKKIANSDSDVPKKKKERGKSRNKEIEEYQERQKSEYLQKKRKKFADDDEERKTVEKEQERNEKRPKKPKRKGVVSEDDDEESEAKVKKPLKTTKDEVSSDEAERLNKQKNFSSKKMPKVGKKTKPIQPAVVQDSDEVPKVVKKPAPEDLESEDDPKVKNAVRGGAEYDDEPKTVKKSSSKYVQSDDEPKTVKKPAVKILDSDDEEKPVKKPTVKVLESDDEQKTVKKSAKDDTESEDEPKTVKKPAKEVSASDESKPVKKPAKTSKTVDQNQSQEEESEEIEVSSRRPHFVPRTVDLTRKNKDFYQDRKWPDGIVPYIIQEDPKYDIDDMRQRLAEVNSILKEKTCVQLREIKPTETNKYEDYLVLDTSPDYVTGRVGGRQNFGVVELFQGGQHRQHAAMMAMAMLGFYFECSRHDRDKFIRVHARHVRADKLHHFEKIRSDATLHLPYDYRSATHPAWQFWRHLGRTGISTVATYKEKDPDGSVMKQLGQNEQLLSDFDLIKINSIYGIKCFQQPENTLRRKSKV